MAMQMCCRLVTGRLRDCRNIRIASLLLTDLLFDVKEIVKSSDWICYARLASLRIPLTFADIYYTKCPSIKRMC